MKIQPEFFQPKYKHHINKGLSLEPFTDLLSGKYGTIIDFDVYLPTYGVNLQRGLVWTQIQKEQFILSLLRGVSPSKFVAIQHDDRTGNERIKHLKIIDGKQRITTIFSYLKGEFGVKVDDLEIFYDDLHSYLQSDIKDPRDCRWDIHYSYGDQPISDDTMIQLFEQVNFLGTPQDVDHLTKIKNARIL